MDFVDKKQLVWAFAATVVTSLGLTVGSAVLAEKADAGCPVGGQGDIHSNGTCVA